MNIGEATNIKVAIDKCLASPDARQFLEGVCHFRKPTHGPGIEDKDGNVAEGRRQVYLTLLTINELEPDQIVQVYKEKSEA